MMVGGSGAGYWGVFALEPNNGRKWGSWVFGVFTLEPNEGWKWERGCDPGYWGC